MVRRTKEEAERTRQAILDAAEETFMERGVSNTTLERISKAAGVTRGALYWHFRNKADVMTALVERVDLPIDTLLADIAEADDGARDLLERTRALIHDVFQKLTTDPRRRRVFTILIEGTEMVGEMRPLRDHFEAMGRAMVDTLQRVMERCRENGELAEGVDPRTAAAAVHAFIIGIHKASLSCGGSFDPGHHGPDMIDLLFRGLARG